MKKKWFAWAVIAFTYAASGALTAPTARPVQRTLAALEASTAERPARVRILFYGQSIVGQRWHTRVVEELKKRYPTALLEVENRAIGGFTSESLIRTAESDLYPYYPDLLFFHVYGSTKKYEEIIRKVRAVTTAEIVLWTSHLDRKECTDRKTIEGLLAKPDARSREILSIAARYGCLAVDLRKKWCRKMLETGLGPDDLLADTIHLKKDGVGMTWYPEFLVEELVRLAGQAGEPAYSGKIEEIPVTDPRVHRAKDGSLTLSFTGNRVVAVSDGKGQGAANVLLDRRAPADFAEMFYTTRPSKLISWMPIIKHVDRLPSAQPIAEDWTLTYLPGTAPYGNPILYKVAGSVTGTDGEGCNTNDFVSISGRAVIRASDFHTWQYGYFVKDRIEAEIAAEKAAAEKAAREGAAKPADASGKEPKKKSAREKAAKPGQTVTWSVKPLFTDPYVPTEKAVRTVLVQNCANGPHVLTVKPGISGRVGVQSFIVYTPAGE